MQVLQQLISKCSRCFCGDSDVIILDIISRVSILSEDQLALALNVNIREGNKIASKLKADKWLECYTTQDRKKQLNYYFINWKQLIHLIKYKIHVISKQLETTEKVETNNLKCPSCHSEYSIFEVNSLEMDVEGFLCPTCRVSLQDTTNTTSTEASDKYTLFMQQIKPIIDLLRKADDMTLPEVNLAELEASNMKLQDQQTSEQQLLQQTEIKKNSLDDNDSKREITVEIVHSDSIGLKRPIEDDDSDEDEFVNVNDTQVVKVNGEYIQLDLITNEHKVIMTPQEYKSYEDILKS